MGPFVTISGTAVDAGLVIDALVGRIAELALENASLRAQVGTWSALAHSQVVDGAPDAQRASESPPGASAEVAESPPGWNVDLSRP